MAHRMSRAAYADMFGPTTGDRVRLADTSLFVEVERDLTVYGEETRFGAGRLVRDGMGQSTATRAECAVDTVITNALILDHWGVVKADVGLKDGRICAIGKAGNPEAQPQVDIVIGPGTEIVAGEGRILTAGAVDVHAHFICPQQVETALTAGVTTMLGGGTGPATGSRATACTPGPWHIARMLQAADALPINLGFTGKGSASRPEGLVEQIAGGACALALHEDWGSSPAAIGCCLDVADDHDVQVILRTDTLNESGFIEDALAALGDRPVHACHSQGAGGGHAPDMIRIAGIASLIPSSSGATRPYTANTVDEHLDMLMACHHLDPKVPEDVAFAESRIRRETIAAADVLHDLGAFSLLASHGQAMGRAGELLLRAWQTADKMRRQRGRLDGERGENDNFRVRRYLAKYTINPAIAHGIDAEVGSVEVGKRADLCLWEPAFFAVKPTLVLVGGAIAAAPMGDANGALPDCQPVDYQPMFGACGGARTATGVTFTSAAALAGGIAGRLGLAKPLVAVHGTRRSAPKSRMVHNDHVPRIEVDAETCEVRADDELLTCEPAEVLPMAQRYFLF